MELLSSRNRHKEMVRLRQKLKNKKKLFKWLIFINISTFFFCNNSRLPNNCEKTRLEWNGKIISEKDFEKKTKNGTGKFIGWDENGNKYVEIDYKDGKIHGKWIEWWFQGHKEFEKDYIEGKPHGKWIRWRLNTGKKESEIEYRNGKKHGIEILWYENGNKWMEKNYKFGKAHGKFIVWHENGQKELEGQYKKGEKHGKFYYWDANGNLKSIETWNEGKFVNEYNKF
jgi:antitoxin component YwqK of YwqJK toxin-antitoxin module